MDSWPHGPYHSRLNVGTIMVTSGTYGKEHFFRTDERLNQLQDSLIALTGELDIELHAWSIFSNHYHIVVHLPDEDDRLRRFIRLLHGRTAIYVNGLDQVRGRKIWHQYWDTQLTYEKSYLARLKYVHYNPVKHGLVKEPRDYRWCSARWFEDTAPRSFVDSVLAFKIDKISVYDDF